MCIGVNGGEESNKKQQQVAYARLAATMYYIQKLINHALWETEVLGLEVVIKLIQVDICISVKCKLTSKWCERERTYGLLTFLLNF